MSQENNEFSVLKAHNILFQYSLINLNQDGYSINPLLVKVVQHIFCEQEGGEAVSQFLMSIARIFLSFFCQTKENTLLQALIPHAVSLIKHLETLKANEADLLRSSLHEALKKVQENSSTTYSETGEKKPLVVPIIFADPPLLNPGAGDGSQPEDTVHSSGFLPKQGQG